MNIHISYVCENITVLTIILFQIYMHSFPDEGTFPHYEMAVDADDDTASAVMLDKKGTWRMSCLNKEIHIINKQLSFCKNVNKQLMFISKYKLDMGHVPQKRYWSGG